MIIPDSSVWIECLKGQNKHPDLNALLQKTKEIAVPTIVHYEVFRYFLRFASEDLALEISEIMSQSQLIPITKEITFHAAQLSIKERLALADSMILACAQKQHHELWTMDKDFEGIDGVKYFSK
jgi:predicted nucleic acid-binding protein